jgi:hypothetical protein
MNGYDRFFDFQRGRSGSFFTNLFRAISVADHQNLAKLEKGFPEEVEAWRLFAHTEGGLITLLTRLSGYNRTAFAEWYGLVERGKAKS